MTRLDVSTHNVGMGYTNNTTTDHNRAAAHYATAYHRDRVASLTIDLATLAECGADDATIAELVADIRAEVTELAAAARKQARINRAAR